MVIFNSYVSHYQRVVCWATLQEIVPYQSYQVWPGVQSAPGWPWEWSTLTAESLGRPAPMEGGRNVVPFLNAGWLLGFPIISIMDSENLQYRRVTNATSDSSDRRFSTLLHWVEHTSIPLEKHTSPSLAPKRLETPLAHHKKSPPQTGVFHWARDNCRWMLRISSGWSEA